MSNKNNEVKSKSPIEFIWISESKLEAEWLHEEGAKQIIKSGMTQIFLNLKSMSVFIKRSDVQRAWVERTRRKTVRTFSCGVGCSNHRVLSPGALVQVQAHIPGDGGDTSLRAMHISHQMSDINAAKSNHYHLEAVPTCTHIQSHLNAKPIEISRMDEQK